MISNATGLDCRVADDPLTCVARGGGRVLELIDEGLQANNQRPDMLML